MKLRLKDLTETDAKEICSWKYDGQYSIYNYPEWDKISIDKWAITLEEKRSNEFNAVVDDYSNLCGYIRIVNKDEYVLIGIGLKPSLCGQGLGSAVMKTLKQQCSMMYPDKKIVLEVRSFNERAIRCYKKAGFKVVGTYKKDTPIGHGEFIRMEYKCNKKDADENLCLKR